MRFQVYHDDGAGGCANLFSEKFWAGFLTYTVCSGTPAHEREASSSQPPRGPCRPVPAPQQELSRLAFFLLLCFAKCMLMRNAQPLIYEARSF